MEFDLPVAAEVEVPASSGWVERHRAVVARRKAPFLIILGVRIEWAISREPGHARKIHIIGLGVAPPSIMADRHEHCCLRW